MMVRRTLFVLLFVVSLAGFADDREISTTGTLDLPVMTLLDPGQEPRQPLRFKAEVGATTTLDVTVNLSIQKSRGTMVGPKRKLPTMRLTMQTTVSEIDADGDISYHFTYTDADVVNDSGVGAMALSVAREILQSFIGLQGEGVMSDRGVCKETKIDAPASLNDSLRRHVDSLEDSLGQIHPPFPVEPVGLGARWIVEKSVKQSGLVATQTALFTLAVADGDRIELAVEIVQKADPQPLTGDPDTLTSSSSQGSGRITIELDRLFPIKARLGMVTDKTTTIEARQQVISQRTEMVMEMRAREQ